MQGGFLQTALSAVTRRSYARHTSALSRQVTTDKVLAFRTIPVPDWVHGLLDDWTRAAGISAGSVFRRVSSAGRVWGEAVTEKLVWHVVKEFAAKIGVRKLAPHDFCISCDRLC